MREQALLLAAAIPYLAQRSLQGRQRREVLFAADLFLDRNHRLQVENPNPDTFAKVHFNGVRQKILVAASAPNRSEQIEWAMPCAQVKVTETRQVRRLGTYAPLRLNAKKSIQPAEGVEQPIEVLRLARMNDVHIQGGDWSAVQNGGQAADDYEIHAGLGQRAHQREWFMFGH